MKTKFTADYFIKKSKAIPEERWSPNKFVTPDGANCINGHCGVRNTFSGLFETDESKALQQLFSGLKITDLTAGNIEVSDGGYSCFMMPQTYSLKAAVINRGEANEYQQPTPKQRILAALYDIKKLQKKRQTAKTPEPKGVTMTFEKLQTVQPIYQS